MKNEKYICLDCGQILRLHEIRARKTGQQSSYECPICLSKDQIQRVEDIVKSDRIQNTVQDLAIEGF
jgi:DNA-directed RNA polymerase subunit RPC12/RpoP